MFLNSSLSIKSVFRRTGKQQLYPRESAELQKELGKGGDPCQKDRRSPSHLIPCDSKRADFKV